MLDTCNPWHVSARSIGPMARSTLDEAMSGEVCAVFARTFYVRTECGLLCVGAGDMYDGPLTLVTNAPETTNWQASGVRVRQHVVLRSRDIAVGLGLVIAWGEVTEWMPPRAPAIDAGMTSKGIARLRAKVVDRLPMSGLAEFVVASNLNIGSSLAVVAEGPVRRIRAALSVALSGRRLFQPAPSDVAALVGLGPGLTPSGDDFLGGMMVGLHAVHQDAFAQDLWRIINDCNENAVNIVSWAHLRAAADGMAADGILRLACVIGSGGNIDDEILTAVDRIGHTSGWDVVAGLVIALETWTGVMDNASTNRIN